MTQAGPRTTCPQCGHDRFFEGPHGGLAVNVKCSSCSACFNCTPLVPFDWDPIADAGMYRSEPKTIAQIASGGSLQ